MPHFHHERLIVYQRSIAFISEVESILASIERPVAARDQLRRSALSIPINIAEANATTGGAGIHLLEIAIGSALESAAAIDVLAVRGHIDSEAQSAQKLALCEVVAMLYGLRDSRPRQDAPDDSNRLGEPEPASHSAAPREFSHERLDLYQKALLNISDGLALEEQLPTSLQRDYDKATTSVVLNIAEGNGRFTRLDRGRFIDVAKRAVLKASALIDVGAARCEKLRGSEIEKLKGGQVRVFQMLEKLQQAVRGTDAEEDRGETTSKITSKGRDSVKYS